MLTLGIFSLILTKIFISKKEIFIRISLGILLYSLILSSQSFIPMEISINDIGLLGGLFHTNNLINGVEIYVYILSICLLLLIRGENPLVKKSLSGEYLIIILFSILGMITLICSYDLISTFLAIELQSLSLYIITTITRKEAIAAGLKYYLLGSLSSVILLLGLVLIYNLTGVTQYDSLFSLLSVSISNLSINDLNFIIFNDNILSYSNYYLLSIIIVVLIMVGLLFKMGAAPFHNWAPDVYDGVPTIITSWIAIMGKVSILIFLLNKQYIISNNEMILSENLLNQSLEFMTTGNSYSILMIILGTSAVLSLIIGSVLGLVQHRIKRLLAYSSISHLGFLLLALTTTNLLSITSFLFYMFQYWISLICSFAILIYLGRKSDLQYITFFKGLFQLNPLLSLALIINFFSLTGIPPLIGFFGKQMVLYTSLLNGYYLLSTIAILTSVISAAYYLKIIKTATFDMDSRPYNINMIFDSKININTSSLSYTSWIISIITLITLFFFINPTIILNFIHILALTFV